MSEIAPIPLSLIVPLNGGHLDKRSSGVALTTDSRQWSLSAEVDFPVPGINSQPRIIRVGLTVEAGVLGVGWLRQDRSGWVTRASIGCDKGKAEIVLVLPAGTSGGTLVFDNWSGSGECTRGVIQNIRVTETLEGSPQTEPRPAIDHEMLVFLHIPKTGGTTVWNLLVQALNPAINIGAPEHLKNLLQMPEHQIRQYKVAFGHMPYGLHSFIPQPCRYIVFLRDPIDRLISAYYHIKRVPEHFLHNRVKSGVTLLEFAGAAHEFDEQDDKQTRSLGQYDIFQWRIAETLNRSHLEKAKERLRSCYFVGIQEELDGDIRRLARDLNISLPTDIPRHNETANRPTVKDVDNKTIDAILKANMFDVELYDYALSIRR